MTTQLPVTAAGRNLSTVAMLRVSGAKTFWMGSGELTATGFTARWTARAFGAAATGAELAIAPP